MDCDQMFSMISPDEFLFDLTEGQEKLQEIVGFIKSAGERVKEVHDRQKAEKNQQAGETGNCLYDLLATLEAVFKPRGGKAFIFNSAIPLQGKGALIVNDSEIKNAVAFQNNPGAPKSNPQTLFKCQVF